MRYIFSEMLQLEMMKITASYWITHLFLRRKKNIATKWNIRQGSIVLLLCLYFIHSVQTKASQSVFPSGFTHKTRVLQCENVAIFNEVSKPYYAMDMLMPFRKAPAGCIPVSIFCRWTFTISNQRIFGAGSFLVSICFFLVFWAPLNNHRH